MTNVRCLLLTRRRDVLRQTCALLALSPVLALGAFAPGSDPEAVDMANRMLDHLGGRERWAAARWLHVREDVHVRGARTIALSEFWRRLDEPGWWGRSTGADGSVLRLMAVTPTEAWTWREGRLTVHGPAYLQQSLGWWHQEIYTMYHRLAKGDAALRLAKTDSHRFFVLDDESGRGLCWFEVDGDGSIAKWSTAYGTDSVEYVYGRTVGFADGVRLPAWGTLVNGRFRFQYTYAQLHRLPLAAPFERPAPSASHPAASN